MKVRIENQNLKFKISEEELKTLLSERCLHTKIDFLEKVFVICVNPQKKKESTELKFILEGDEAYISLLIPFTKIQELEDLGRSRQGIEEEVNGIFISLQVDIRNDSRKVKG